MNNATTSPVNPVDPGHQWAWEDLAQRISDGVRDLWALKSTYEASGNREQAERLDGKVHGVLVGQDLYRSVQAEFLDDPGTGEALDTDADHETAWLTLTARLYEAAQTETASTVRQGLLLVNRWQTGYGPEIDAPQIVPA